jgi:hypothetical protein
MSLFGSSATTRAGSAWRRLRDRARAPVNAVGAPYFSDDVAFVTELAPDA